MPISTDRVTVFGGTGFLGRSIVKRLVRTGKRVRVATRHPASAQTEGVEQFLADVRDEAAVGAAIEGTGAAVNAVGLYAERGDETFDAVHVQGALHVARQAALALAPALLALGTPGTRTLGATQPAPHPRPDCPHAPG